MGRVPQPKCFLVLRILLSVLVVFSFPSLADTSAYPWRAPVTDGYPMVLPQASIRDVQRLLQNIEQGEGQFSPGLYRPLKALGERFLAVEKPEPAIGAFQRMQTLVHRHEGVGSPFQREAQLLLVQAYGMNGDYAAVDRQENLMYHIAEEAHLEDSLDMHKARWRLATWFQRTGRASQATTLLQDSAALLAGGERPNAYAMVLRLQARNQYLTGRCCAVQSMVQAVKAVTFADDSKLMLARELDDLRFLTAELPGDKVYPQSAGESPAYLGYRNASQIRHAIAPASVAARREVVRFRDAYPEEHFAASAAMGSPVAICRQTVNDELPGRRLDRVQFNVSLNVDATGQASDIAITGKGPARLKHILRRAMTRGQFRPAMDADGIPVADTLTFTQTFGEAQGGAMGHVAAWGLMLAEDACREHYASQMVGR